MKEVTVTDLRREERVGLRRDAVPQHQQMPMAAFRIQGATWPVARAESDGQDRSNYQFYHSNKAYDKRIEQVNAPGSKHRQMNTLCGHFIPMQENRSSFRFFLQF